MVCSQEVTMTQRGRFVKPAHPDPSQWHRILDVADGRRGANMGNLDSDGTSQTSTLKS